MASIFTFDPDPPRVASPWCITARKSGKLSDAHDSAAALNSTLGEDSPASRNEVEKTITCLEAEPQSGPTEYKLHLLMRPRQSLSYTSTPRHISGSRHSQSVAPTYKDGSASVSGSTTPLPHSGNSRQHRLEQLTTQLLWRLQQSSPYHTTAPNNLILPSLPDVETRLQSRTHPAKLLSGLEESKGALYEIGVSDDGTFVGLTKDEMDESLDNLRAMAFSLGCTVKILRMVAVGYCESIEEGDPNDSSEAKQQAKQNTLYVSEAYIKPVLNPDTETENNECIGSSNGNNNAATMEDSSTITVAINVPDTVATQKEQLRVSITGATTCGKSSLLGTLSTSTLDTGRGKSRLSLLKHRHEIVSGMTSSVAQELIGYRDLNTQPKEELETQVVNYATGNVSSWDDIHAASEPGRLAFVLDSAGHPRYRRTTVRSLVGWAPHWTLLCIAANDGADSLTQDGSITPEGENFDFPGASAHISMAHLDICLRLDLSLVVVITKMDIASRTSIRQVLSAILTTLKSAGRIPSLLSNDNFPGSEDLLQTISSTDSAEVLRVCNLISEKGEKSIVPILFTSAVKGTGISKLQGLLRYLPIPAPNAVREASRKGNSPESRPRTLFHVSDCFALGPRRVATAIAEQDMRGVGHVLSGRLACGTIAIGDTLYLGPFSSEIGVDLEEPDALAMKTPIDPFLSPRSFGDAYARVTNLLKTRAISSQQEWQQVKVVSIRNLRLPVRQLLEDQVGTIGIIASDTSQDSQSLSIRKGMVLARQRLISAHTFSARFEVAEAGSVVVGSLVVIYCGSVRASAKVVAVSLNNGNELAERYDDHNASGQASDDGFGFEFEADEDEKDKNLYIPREHILVTFQFLRCREFCEVGSKVLVMPSGGQGIAGLEGFVGIVERSFG